MSLKIKTFYLFFIIFSTSVKAQNKIIQFEGRENNEVSKVIAINDGDHLIGGYFEDSANFNNYYFKSLGTSNVTASKKTSDVFIAKLDSSGNVEWAKIFGGFDKSGLKHFIKDKSGDFLLLADFTKKFIAGKDTLNGIQNRDCAITKLDVSGDIKWSKAIVSKVNVSPVFIINDDSNNIYISVNCKDSFYIDNIAYHHDFMTGALVKLDVQGNVKWTKILYTTSSSTASLSCMSFLPNGDFILAIGTDKYTTFLDGIQITGDDTTYRTCLLKMSANDKVLWKNIAIGPYTVKNIEIYENEEIYIGGIIFNSVVINNKIITPLDVLPLNDIFLAKYNKDGNLNWFKVIGKKDRTDYYYKLKRGTNNKLYIAADYASDYNLADTTLFTPGRQDFYLAEFDTNSLLTNILTSKGENNLCLAGIGDFDVDSESNIYIAGAFNFITNFDSTKLSTTGKSDGFLWKINNWSTPASVNYNQSYSSNFVINIFPNPSTGFINIDFTFNKQESLKFEITDLAGRTFILKPQATYQAGSYTEKFLFNGLTSGCYFIKAITREKVECRKLIINAK